MEKTRLYELFDLESIRPDTVIDLYKEVSITDDAEKITPKTVFFLTKRASGNSRLGDISFPINPYAVVCEADDAERISGQRLIITENTRSALSHAYSRLYKISYEKMKLIAVTGTNGKTSVARMLHSILRYNDKEVGYIGTGAIMINDTVVSEKYYSMTTPDPELLYRSLKEMELLGCEYVIMEASSHAISLGKLDAITFDYGIFTNLSPEHMDYHRDMEDYYKSKKSLFDRCQNGIFNLDDAYSRRAYNECECRKISVGIIERGDVFATDIQSRGLLGTYFFYRTKSLIFGVDLKPVGAFNVYNALMALCCSIDLGIKPTLAKQAINCIEYIPGRLEVLRNKPCVVIDYAHTAEAMENALKSLYSYKNTRQRLICVFGCGGERDKSKRASMGSVAEKYSEKIILTQDNSRGEKTENIVYDILSGISSKSKVSVNYTREEAIREAILSSSDEDIVVILGKGREPYIIDADGYRDYSDRDEATKALMVRRGNENNT